MVSDEKHGHVRRLIPSYIWECTCAVPQSQAQSRARAPAAPPGAIIGCCIMGNMEGESGRIVPPGDMGRGDIARGAILRACLRASVRATRAGACVCERAIRSDADQLPFSSVII